ncbi:MMPL family transporter [Amycolatopsis ruanii]|uniref:MMPL family transporter n=1 Tax=Amycolatopsis ruanii TaxID=944491 RepID=UPI000E27431C|nr:MMPL family transporter [Amycolatopsis ruanii]
MTTSTTAPGGALSTLARRLLRHRVRALVLAAFFAVLAGVFGSVAAGELSSGGYTAPSFESVRADRMLADRFHAGAPDFVLVVRAGDDVSAHAAAGTRLTERLATTPGVRFAHSYWTTGDPALRSADGRSALVVAKLSGDDTEISHTARALAKDLGGRHDGLDVLATGSATVNEEADRQSAADLTRAELIAAPLTLLILLVAFGLAAAAALPVLIGAVTVAGTLAILRLLTTVTPVSIFGLNIATALGFGLAVDYSLFLVTRYREELAAGRDTAEAIVTMLRTAGRTVLFSAVTVGLSLSALLVFPIYFLRSLAFAGIAVVALAALASILVLPPVLALLGHRLDRFDPFARLRRHRLGLWRRLAVRVMRRPVLVGASAATVLVALALPFGQAQFGLLDDRVLPRDSPAQIAGDAVRTEFPGGGAAPVVVVLPDADPPAVAAYAQSVAGLPGTARVDIGASSGQGGWLSVASTAEPNSAAAEEHVRAVRALPAPGPALVGGDAAVLTDTKDMLAERIPWAALIIVVSMLVLLFLFSGSVVIPLKQLVLTVLSLTASFGAMVYVFQDGHLKWLVGDFVHTGQLEVTVPILMFCIAFGLSMDYSVFLLSRIREEYLAHGDNTRAVAAGLERTGRLVSAAALVVAVVLAAVATSGLSVLKLLGVGLALAVLVDATLVRGLLVPSAMRLLGAVNWWAPARLRRWHDRFGLHD